MAFGMWSGTLSVILTPSGAQGEELLALARDWTREGLLGPALWVRPEAVTVEDGVPPTIGAIVMMRSETDTLLEDTVDLFEVLANEPLHLVRLIKVRSTTIDTQADELQDGVANVVTTYVTYSMPLLNPSQSGSTDRTELLRVSLICAPTDFQLNDRVESIASDTSVLVLASPEDRATPGSGDAFVRVNERFTGFVLMHLATVGGLWSGLPVGSLELFEREGSAAQAIWIPRVFVSGVLTGGLVRRVAARSLQELAADAGLTGSGAQVTAAGTFVIPPENVDEYVEDMVRSAMGLADGVLDYRVPEGELPPATKKVGILRQLGLFGRFSIDKLRGIPRWMRLGAHDSIARSIDAKLNGPEGYRAIELQLDQELDARDKVLMLTTLIVKADDERAQTAASAPMLAGRPPSARLWSGLRQLTFRAIDGSTNDAGIGFPLVDSVAPVFGDLSDVVPDPDSAWTPPGPRPSGFPESVTWLMAREHPELRAALEEAVVAARAEVDSSQNAVHEAETALAGLNDEVESTREALVGAGLLRMKADGKFVVAKPPRAKAAKAADSEAADGAEPAPPPPAAEPEGPTVEQYRVLETRVQSQEAAVTVAGAALEGHTVRLEQAEDVLNSFDEWLMPRRRSFAWRAMDRMSDAETRAAADLGSAEAGQSNAPDHGELIRLRKRFHRGLIIATSIIGGLTALAIALPYIIRALIDANVDEPSRTVVRAAADFFLSKYYPDWWWLLLIGVGLLLIVVVILLVAYYAGHSKFERRVQVEVYRLQASTGRIRALRAELNRLRSVHRSTLDWLGMMSTAMHRPWEVRSDWLEEDGPQLDSKRLPYAMHIAQAVDSTGPSADALKFAAATELVKTGWRARAFADLVDESRIQLGLDATRLNVDALDNDTPDASNNARRRLIATMGNEDVLHGVADRRLHELTQRLGEAAVYTDQTEVVPIRADPLAAFRGSAKVPTDHWLPFLERTLGTSIDVPTPLSPLVIAPHQVQQAHHLNVTSYVLAPTRIAEDLSSSAAAATTVKAYDAETSDSFDVVVRVDMIGPVPAAAVRLWSDEKRSTVSTATTERVPVCAECGRADCPAAVPGSLAECAYSGV